MEHQVAGSGQGAFEADLWSLHQDGPTFDLARVGKEGSQVPPEDPKTNQIYYGKEERVG